MAVGTLVKGVSQKKFAFLFSFTVSLLSEVCVGVLLFVNPDFNREKKMSGVFFFQIMTY